MVYGQSAATGITTTNVWNNRFQPVSFTAVRADNNAVQALRFTFNQGTSSAPIDNGMLTRIDNDLHPDRSTNYRYDTLNRITMAWHDGGDWGNMYTVDLWGNLYQKSACNGSVCPVRAQSDSMPPGLIANTKNRLDNNADPYSYDLSGNLLNDKAGHLFVYDAENRPASVTTIGSTYYYYDGEGERVAKSTGKLYLFGTNSAPVVETDANGNVTAEYIFFNGKRVAMRKPDNSVHYYYADQIGSATIVTNADGSQTEQEIEYHPYGEQKIITDTLGQEYRFTGKEHDDESNNDYFGARYYSSTSGRFFTPDWTATPIAIPYAVMGNPQTLNLYAYVGNNPITGTDPDGHTYAESLYAAGVVGDRSDAPREATTMYLTTNYTWKNGYGWQPTGFSFSYMLPSPSLQQQSQSQNQQSQWSTTPPASGHYLTNAYYPNAAAGNGHWGAGLDTPNATEGFATNDRVPRFLRAIFLAVGIPLPGAVHPDWMVNQSGVQRFYRPLTDAQFEAAQIARNKREHHPGWYSLYFRNCALWVQSVDHAAGVRGVPHIVSFPKALRLWYPQQ